MPETSSRDSGVALRDVAMAALARTTGSPLVEGNAVRILRDAPENYPAWEQAIETARRSVQIEMYSFRRDYWGQRFAALLARRAAAGVKVRLLCDWFGCLSTPRRLFRDLQRNGGEVRFFNRPHPARALAVVRRNHRKVKATYEADLENSDEIVRSAARAPRPAALRTALPTRDVHQEGMRGGSGPTGSGSGGQLLREVGNLGTAVGAAVGATRPLESFEFRPLTALGAVLLLVAFFSFWKPHLVSWPAGLLLAVLGLQLVANGVQAQVERLRARPRRSSRIRGQRKMAEGEK